MHASERKGDLMKIEERKFRGDTLGCDVMFLWKK